jgi:hypothetical protein
MKLWALVSAVALQDFFKVSEISVTVSVHFVRALDPTIHIIKLSAVWILKHRLAREIIREQDIEHEPVQLIR